MVTGITLSPNPSPASGRGEPIKLYSSLASGRGCHEVTGEGSLFNQANVLIHTLMYQNLLFFRMLITSQA